MRQVAWAANAVAIGLVSADTTELTAKVAAAADALEVQLAAQQAAKDATTTLHDAARALGVFGADLILKIKAKAGVSGDSVYALASLPVPATPGPVGAPGTPSDFKVGLQPTGALELGWKCSNPAGAVGTIYNVYRKLEGGSGAFEYMGGSGTKKFIDSTLPAGQASVVYQIQAIRSTVVGVANEFTVKFGVSDSGAMIASVTENGPKPAKIAA